jgi:hypothetical protein
MRIQDEEGRLSYDCRTKRDEFGYEYGTKRDEFNTITERRGASSNKNHMTKSGGFEYDPRTKRDEFEYNNKTKRDGFNATTSLNTIQVRLQNKE